MSVVPSKIDTQSTVKDVQTGEEPSDNDPIDDYEMGYGTAPDHPVSTSSSTETINRSLST